MDDLNCDGKENLEKLIAEILDKSMFDQSVFNDTLTKTSTQHQLVGGPSTALHYNMFGMELPLHVKNPSNDIIAAFEPIRDVPASSSPESQGYGSSGSTRSTPSSMHASVPVYCDIHKDDVQQFYCETCHIPLCVVCTVAYHDAHQIFPLESTVEDAVQKNATLQLEANAATNALNAALNKIQILSQSVNAKRYELTMQIKESMQKMVAAVEKRQNELLFRVDNICRSKGNHLKTQEYNLRMAVNKAATIGDLLKFSRESANVLDLMPANKQATQTMKYLNRIYKELLSPCEGDNVLFMADVKLLQGVAQFGSVSAIVNAPPIQHFVDDCGDARVPTSVIPFSCSSPCRPIYGPKRPIVLNRYSSLPRLTFGTEGKEPGELCRPWGLCCDQLGRIFIADRSNNRIQVFDGHGAYLYHFGTAGSGRGQFDRPASVALNPAGHLVVTDKDNHRVQVFKADGTFMFAFGEKGSRNGHFHYPWDVACNAQGQIVVSDTRNHRIQLFNADGMFLTKYGFENCAGLWKQFDTPRGVCFTPQGYVLCTDFNNHRIVVFNKMLRKIRVIGCQGEESRQFTRPQGVVCDDEGNIVVADSRNNRIQIYDRNGDPVDSIGSAGVNPGEFNTPTAVCLTPDGSIVVLDFGNTRVQVF